MISNEEAVRQLRGNPGHADLIRDSYLDADPLAAAERFRASAEFAQVLSILGAALKLARVLDLGAGSGVASYAIAQAGARQVVALEPDGSCEIGAGAVVRLRGNLPILVVTGCGESIPLRDEAVNVVYVRQALHHARDLNRVLQESARVLKPGGILLATREHVVRDAQELAIFLAGHTVHQLTGGENAFPLHVYCRAIQGSGLRLIRVWRPWETVINAFPEARSLQDLVRLQCGAVERRLGPLRILSRIPPVRWLVWARVRRPLPGALYSFLARKLPRRGWK